MKVKKIKREKSCLFYGFDLKVNDFRNSKSELKDNIFNKMGLRKIVNK